ncbi:MAG: hypothetical protein RJA81_812 [Planctomycetota bacterium]
MMFSALLISITMLSQVFLDASKPPTSESIQVNVITNNAPDGEVPVFSLSRNLMLEMLEFSKQHKPRLPLPEPTSADLEKSKSNSLGLVNNGLMRRYYLPDEWSGAGFPRGSVQNATVSYRIKTELFWIISRINQCAYCLGHQESKLASEGLSESEIASLDGDWSDATPAIRAARQLAVWKTLTPEKPVPDEIWSSLATEFNRIQQSEILLAIANYNAMNRWTGPLNIPQEKHRVFRSTLSSDRQNKPSQLKQDDRTSWNRRILPTFSDWLKTVNQDGDNRRFVFEPERIETQQSVHNRLLNTQGLSGETRIRSWKKALLIVPPTDDFPLPVELRGKILWVCARLDNAPHVARDARHLLKKLGVSDVQLEQLEDLSKSQNLDEPTRQALKLAALITTNPAWVTQQDIEDVRQNWGNRATAQIIELACIAAAFDRLCP